MLLDIILALALIGLFFLLLHIFKDYIITLIVLGSIGLIAGLVFWQYVFWIALLGIFFLAAMFLLFFIGQSAED
ncbi:MAG: hypothetical protein HY831_01240 [Candidatus Aenigmarchaeota archaeon]|nr:hypothetical protein [Candidatus Aenigmarchaeota archaeon]